ncbi:aminopeptidase [Legionella taurinensis]|uniref:Aminopeptidase n=1 Tax=Legionella taurinensis TaxID=70611 RepID=A0A3A5LGG9_9GAMM|nr:M20/M25/M40 family metallo-hydrolase [Legionella taurinensis]MDX1837763.1 M20/M25/M40 family metallo-hydrolase [Legionella taurinensis]PUT39729.1 aminopeptidase [Legionella taurinensis]PUT43422.1 aminopeptidase [Legionella taurinensis]PUT45868.1 aminopeptidase [Legionella taurinensis]PUT47780.1 aminopeptidase [Legionella taurinensis]
MRLKQWMIGLSASVALAGPVVAKPVVINEQLQVPQCLASHLSSDYPVLAENRNFKIISVPSDDLDTITRLADKVGCGHYINVSHKLARAKAGLLPEKAQALLNAPPKKAVQAENYEIKHQAEVDAVLAQVNADNIWDTLTHLTNYYNRSATKDTGVETANWIKASFEKMATEYGRQDTDTYLVKTGWYKQPSVVTVIGKDIKAPGIVIGAHMDTLDGRMPGAGDDGSGSSSVMEIARVLLASDQKLKRPVYIIWYAAEERGLVGSQHVVEEFMNKSIPVKAAIQFDMTGFRNDPKDQTIWVFKDYTDKKLSDFVASLITQYVKVPVNYSRCGYGCSDHASWTDEGIPAAFPCETSFDDHNPYIHTSSDTMSLLSLEHMTNFTRLGLAFAIELASE